MGNAVPLPRVLQTIEIRYSIAKGRRQRAEGSREKLDGSWFQYLARVLIALATAIARAGGLCLYSPRLIACGAIKCIFIDN
jgi:hypothetical protein